MMLRVFQLLWKTYHIAWIYNTTLEGLSKCISPSFILYHIRIITSLNAEHYGFQIQQIADTNYNTYYFLLNSYYLNPQITQSSNNYNLACHIIAILHNIYNSYLKSFPYWTLQIWAIYYTTPPTSSATCSRQTVTNSLLSSKSLYMQRTDLSTSSHPQFSTFQLKNSISATNIIPIHHSTHNYHYSTSNKHTTCNSDKSKQAAKRKKVEENQKLPASISSHFQ